LCQQPKERKPLEGDRISSKKIRDVNKVDALFVEEIPGDRIFLDKFEWKRLGSAPDPFLSIDKAGVLFKFSCNIQKVNHEIPT
jgi:hypothetical protein